LKADAPNNRLTWALASTKRCGCERFRFNGHTATLVAQPPGDPSGPVEVTVDSDGQFQLLVERDGKKWDFAVKAGKNHFTLGRQPLLKVNDHELEYANLKTLIPA
jgi:hypothetical protein